MLIQLKYFYLDIYIISYLIDREENKTNVEIMPGSFLMSMRYQKTESKCHSPQTT